MSFVKPVFTLGSVFDINADMLKKAGIKALLLDVDNTLAIYHTDFPINGVDEWISQMRDAGISLHILSNAKPKRLTKFANRVGLDYFYMSLKPLPFKINKAIKKLGFKKSEVAIIGDQYFTDVLGARLSGINCFWTKIIQPEDKLSFKFKRKLEIPIRKHCEKRCKRLKGAIK